MSNPSRSNGLHTAHWALLQRLQAYELDDRSQELGFVRRLRREHGWDRAFTLRAIEEYKRFIFLAVVADHQAVPSSQVDQVWHQHLLMSEAYWEDFCPNVIGRKLHHCPSKGGRQERELFHKLYQNTISNYRQFFGEPPADLWPPGHSRFHLDWHPRRRWLLPWPGRSDGHLAAPLVGSVLLTQAIATFAGPSTGTSASPTGGLFAGSMANATIFPPPGFSMVLLSLAAGLAMRAWIRRPSRMRKIPALNPRQLAYLARGNRGFLEMVLAEMVRAGRLNVNCEEGTLLISTHPAQADMPTHERLVMNHLRKDGNLKGLQRELAFSDHSPHDLTKETMTSMVRLRLQVAPEDLYFAAGILILGLAAVALFLLTGLLSAFLPSGPLAYSARLLMSYFMVLIICSIIFCFPQKIARRTRWGDSTLKFYQKQHDIHDPMMRIALHGPSAMSGGELDDLRQLLTNRQSKVYDDQEGYCNSCG